MKYPLTVLFIFLIQQTLNAQLYNKALKIEYDVYHIVKNDTIRSKLNLDCTGEKWTPQNIPIDNNWTIIWNHNDFKTGKDYSEKTGVEETSEKLFIHPPRSNEYRILEFCPFPLVHYPIMIGKSWDWELENIADPYYRVLISKTQQKTTVKNKYKVIKKVSWFYKKANTYIDCFEIQCTGRTALGDTQLTFYFSP